jgi:hypothetical protein
MEKGYYHKTSISIWCLSKPHWPVSKKKKRKKRKKERQAICMCTYTSYFITIKEWGKEKMKQ